MLEALKQRTVAKTFTEKILFLLPLLLFFWLIQNMRLSFITLGITFSVDQLRM